MNLADNLKRLRKEHSLSQEALADKLNVSRQSVSKWESNQAYPEMDKVLQICDLFNLTLDELMNQNIKEVNTTTQGKNSINKFIDDFLSYLTKTIDLFSSLKFKDKIKCLFEQILIITVVSIILFIIGQITSSALYGILDVLPFGTRPLYLLAREIYNIACIVIVVIIVLHTFKVRYLDYYEIVREEPKQVAIDKIQNNESMNPEEKIRELKPKNKIIIRDPDHTGYKFITSLLKFFVAIIKVLVIFAALFFCFTLIILTISFVATFVIIKTGLTFIGLTLTILSCIAVNVLFLILMFNFVFSRKTNIPKVGKIFLISLLTAGVGIGIFCTDMPNYRVISSVEDKNYIKEEKTFSMTDDLRISDYMNYNVEFVESPNQDVKVVWTHSKFLTRDIFLSDNCITFDYIEDENVLAILKDQIENINHKTIVDYSAEDLKIYTTKENIAKLAKNYEDYHLEQTNRHYNEVINELNEELNNKEDQITELESELFDKENKINELENEVTRLEDELRFQEIEE